MKHVMFVSMLLVLLTACTRSNEPIITVVKAEENSVLWAEHRFDGWHGNLSLPGLTVGDEVTITVHIHDERGRIIALDNEVHTFKVTMVEGFSNSPLTIENQGDTATLRATRAGHAHLVFHWLKDGVVVHSTTSIDIRVFE